MDEDRISRLRSLLEGLDKDKANEIMIEAGLLKGKSTRKTPTKIVIRSTTYKTIHKNTICKHCCTRRVEDLVLHKDEEFIATDEDSRSRVYQEKNVKDGLVVDNYVNCCGKCRLYVKTLARDELERRYMIMLKEYGIKMPGIVQTT